MYVTFYDDIESKKKMQCVENNIAQMYARNQILYIPTGFLLGMNCAALWNEASPTHRKRRMVPYNDSSSQTFLLLLDGRFVMALNDRAGSTHLDCRRTLICSGATASKFYWLPCKKKKFHFVRSPLSVCLGCLLLSIAQLEAPPQWCCRW